MCSRRPDAAKDAAAQHRTGLVEAAKEVRAGMEAAAKSVGKDVKEGVVDAAKEVGKEHRAGLEAVGKYVVMAAAVMAASSFVSGERARRRD